MNRRLWVFSMVCLLLMGMAASVLLRLRAGHRLGPPGLKLSAVALTNELGATVATNSIHLPEQVLDYRSTLAPIMNQEVEWLPRDTTYGRRRYVASDGFGCQVNVVLMGTDRTSIHKPEYCLPAQGFQIVKHESDRIVIERPHRYELPVMKFTASREVKGRNGSLVRANALYVFWFVSGNQLTEDHLERMWWMARDLFRTGELPRWAYVGILALCQPGGEEAAYARMKEFIRAAVPEFQLVAGAPNDAPAGTFTATLSPP
jgi:hypothetical protein